MLLKSSSVKAMTDPMQELANLTQQMIYLRVSSTVLFKCLNLAELTQIC